MSSSPSCKKLSALPKSLRWIWGPLCGRGREGKAAKNNGKKGKGWSENTAK